MITSASARAVYLPLSENAKARPSHQEFLQCLCGLDQEFPLEQDLPLIVDNYGTHKHPKVKSRLARHRRFHFHCHYDQLVVVEFSGALVWQTQREMDSAPALLA